MAKLSQKILGNVSGTLGDITFRQRNGKNYLATRPRSFKAPQDQASIERRSKFALAVKLASIINSIQLLKDLWALKIPAGSTVYNYLVKTNYNQINPDSLTASTYLTPPLGFGVTTSTLTIARENIDIVFEALGTRTGIDAGEEINIQLFGILCLSNPTDINLEKTFLLPFLSEPQASALDTELTFSLPLSSQESQLFDKYDDKKIIFSLVTLDGENNPVHYSATIFG